jgi:hypothetical protein
MFFWSKYQIVHFELNKQINLKNRIGEKDGFKLAKLNHESYIDEVIPNSNPENVLIKI